MKRPLVPVALCYGAGLLAAKVAPIPLVVLFAWAFCVLGVTLCWSARRGLWLGVLFFLCGWTNLTTRIGLIAPHDIRRIAGDSAHQATIRGTLVESPVLRVHDQDDPTSFRTLATVRLEQLKLDAEWIETVGQVMVVTPGMPTNAFYSGQTVEITGVLTVPPTPLAEGLFDYRAHLARLGIHYQLKPKSNADWILVSVNRRPPLKDRFVAWASQTLALGTPVEDEELRLNWAMVLGWKTALTDEVSTPFMRSGTMHIFAISGLHIALLTGILVSVLRVAQLPRLGCGLLVIPLIWFYTAATGWQSSAIRSTIMMTVIIGGWALSRPTDLLNSLAVAALVILVWQPEQLFQPSFQLSFFVVLSIALFMPPLEQWRDRLLRTDPLLPRELVPRWRRWAETPLRWLGTSLATSTAAWLGALPLTLYYFHLLSPVTLLANLLVVPLSSAALASALGSLACGAWCPWLAELFNHSAWLWMRWMVSVSEWSTTLPGAYIYMASPPWWVFVFYYTALLSVVSGKIFDVPWRWLALAALGLLVLLCLREWQRARSEFQITVLPLNGGHAVHVDGPGRAHDWLVDCGASNSVEFITLPFLRAQGVNRLARLALSHGDIQHVGGSEWLCDEIPVGQWVSSSTKFRSPTYRRLMESLEASQSPHLSLNRGDRAGDWRILHPDLTDKFPLADDAGLVMAGTIHQTRVLLLPDLGRRGQDALLNPTNDLTADIVVTGLPDRTEALCDGLLQRIQPKLIIVADSQYPANRRAGASLRERLAQSGVTSVFTRENGAVKIVINPAGWIWSTAQSPPEDRR